MTVVYHPEFPQDIKKFEAQYREIPRDSASGSGPRLIKQLKSSKQRPLPAGIF